MTASLSIGELQDISGKYAALARKLLLKKMHGRKGYADGGTPDAPDDSGGFNLTPVMDNPFPSTTTLTPVDHDPFLPSPTSGDAISSYTPSWSERLGNTVQDTLSGMGMSSGNAQDYARQAQTVAGYTPLVGNALSANDALRDYQQGNYTGAALNAVGAIPIPGAGVASHAVEEGIENAGEQAAKGIVAYHGSPHSFDQFDMSKIGTGEGGGAQNYAGAYGKGMYFAENEDVAKSYQKNLSGDQPGNMYQVGINADPSHFLDWDKTVGEQHPQVQTALSQMPLWRAFDFSSPDVQAMPGASFAPKTAQDMEDFRRAGIPGVKYLDQGSRLPTETQKLVDGAGGDRQSALELAQKRVSEQGFGTGQTRQYWQNHVNALYKPASSNYVVNDAKNITMMRKYGIGGLSMVGAMEAAKQAGEQPTGFSTSPVEGNPFQPGA